MSIPGVCNAYLSLIASRKVFNKMIWMSRFCLMCDMALKRQDKVFDVRYDTAWYRLGCPFFKFHFHICTIHICHYMFMMNALCWTESIRYPHAKDLSCGLQPTKHSQNCIQQPNVINIKTMWTRIASPIHSKMAHAPSFMINETSLGFVAVRCGKQK